MGIKVMSISKVPDDLNVISEKVKDYSNKYDYVLTTGGIGPTHDDITFEAVAKAFNDELVYHSELVKIVKNFYKTDDINHPGLKMAKIPKTANVTFGFDPITNKKAFYPNVSVKNVFMFPGVPILCERLFNFTKNQLFSSNQKFHLKELYLSSNEDLIVNELNSAVNKFQNVLFGSYPKYFHSYYNVKITIESVDESQTVNAHEYLRRIIPEKYQIDYDGDPFSDKLNKMKKLNNGKLNETYEKLERDLLAGKKNSNDIFIYFDGSINSTVLLHVMATIYEKNYTDKQSMNCIYLEKNIKINSYVNETVKNYNLNLLKLNRDNFIHFAKSHGNILIVIGVRKTEPNSSEILKSFNGVNFINPLFDWNYSDLWNVTRNLYLPYCNLYDEGFTTINDVHGKPNPYLKTVGPRSDLIYYKKAHELQDNSLEHFT